MDVIHKVFVSSTYTDLRLERAAVERTLLHLKCFPIGMEIFPAANDSAWDFIKQQIDDSDYYVLIIANRYGSVHPETGKSYTEMEFDYASEGGIPILAFIHEDPGRIHDKDRDAEPEKRALLVSFRHKVQSKKLCKPWKSVEELEARVATTIIAAKDQYPREGFVRAKLAVDHKKMAELIEVNQKLEVRLNEATNNASQMFASGKDSVNLGFNIEGSRDVILKLINLGILSESKDLEGIGQFYEVKFTWDEILLHTGDALLSGCHESIISREVSTYLKRMIAEGPKKLTHAEVSSLSISLTDVSRQDIDVQFHALGLIEAKFADPYPGSEELGKRYLLLSRRGIQEFGRLVAAPAKNPLRS